MSDTNDHFSKLEEKLARAIEIFKKTQAEKRSLAQDLEKARADAKERARQLDELERQVLALRREREDLRTRIEKIIHQIDVLTSSDSER